MKIIVDFRNTYNNDPSLSVYTSEFWQDMASLKPDHSFVFIEEGKRPALRSTENVAIRKVKSTGIGWYDRLKMATLLRNLQADCYVNILQTGFGMHHLMRNKNKIVTREQVLFYNADEYAQNKKHADPVKLVKASPRFNSTDELTWAAAEGIKTQYSGGCSFFLFAGSIDESQQLVALLKAFSGFKKWQQSNMQLLIAGYTTKGTASLEEKLEQYKYRLDVKLIKNPGMEDLSKLAAACYAFTYPVSGNVFPAALLLALQAGSAVIAADSYHNRQVIELAEWVEANNTAEGFAKTMILLYKDEKRLLQLQKQTKETASLLNRTQMMAEVWQCIEK